jgi:hypothetical protein
VYRAEHGDCNVPKIWAEDGPLGNWVARQRQYKRKLDRGEPSHGMSAARAAKLDTLGFKWASSAEAMVAPQKAAMLTAVGFVLATNAANAANAEDDEEWEAQLAQLAAYQAEYGDCKVPPDREFSSWVMKQRQNKRKLDCGEPGEGMTVERVAKLTALGFAWEGSAKEAQWEAQLARLAAYKAAHGDCSVPRGWAEDPRLGRWVAAQRKLKRRLDRGEPSDGMTAVRAARLTALGFTWEGNKARPNEAEWEAQLARLAAYKAAHGDCSVPRGWAEDPRLGNWVSTQRKFKRRLDRGEPSDGMTAARAARLTALGFAWDGWEGKMN